MESNSQYNPQLQLTSQYYSPGDQYVQMYPATATAPHTSNVGYDDKPPALPPKPPTSPYGDQLPSKRYSSSQWSNVPVTSTQWHNTSTHVQWDNTDTPTTDAQWTKLTSTQWKNTATPTTPEWTNPANAHWNNTTANQSLEVQQCRRENVMLQNEIEQLRQQNQQQSSSNDSWITQQNQQLHQQVAQLTQENDELRRKLSVMESELMVLQHSLKTHEEDFEQERRDRVRIHEEKEKLKQELESQAQVIKMLTEEHGGKLMEMENTLGLNNDEKYHCERCNRELYANEMFEHIQKCVQ